MKGTQCFSDYASWVAALVYRPILTIQARSLSPIQMLPPPS